MNFMYQNYHIFNHTLFIDLNHRVFGFHIDLNYLDFKIYQIFIVLVILNFDLAIYLWTKNLVFYSIFHSKSFILNFRVFFRIKLNQLY